jgi:hypothetical protein
MRIRKQAITILSFLLVSAIFGLNAVAQNDASLGSGSTSSSSTSTKKSKKTKPGDANATSTSTASTTTNTANSGSAPAASSSPAQTSTSTTSTTTTSKSSASKTGTKSSAPVEAQTPPQPGMVWVNTASGTYHKSGRWYGKTKEGKFMTEADAVKAGYKPAKD